MTSVGSTRSAGSLAAVRDRRCVAEHELAVVRRCRGQELSRTSRPTPVAHDEIRPVKEAAIAGLGFVVFGRRPPG